MKLNVKFGQERICYAESEEYEVPRVELTCREHNA
jgi:hypothetical protein